MSDWKIHHDGIESLANRFSADARKTALRRFSSWWSDNRDGDPLEAERADILDFLEDVDESGVAPQTLRSYRTSLNVMYETARDLKIVDRSENPVRNVDVSRYVDGYGRQTRKEQYSDDGSGIIYLTREETTALRENVPAPKVRNELLVKLMVQTGARRNEVRDIRLDDIDREKRRVTLEDDKTGKSRRVAYTDLSPELGAWLGKYRGGYKTAVESPYLFVTESSEQLSSSAVTRIVAESAERAGIQDVMYTDAAGRERRRVTAHTLRHTFAVRALQSDGVTLRHLQQLMGHDNIEQTETYLEIGDDEAANAYQDADISFEA